METVFFDSCIWIDYLWQSFFSETNHDKHHSKKLIQHLLSNQSFEVILTPFVISEVSAHFRDYYIHQKIIKDGFSFRDFHRKKKEYLLNDEERQKIDEMIIAIGELEFVNVTDLSGLKADEIGLILNMETEYSFDFYDALHFNSSLENSCKYFVTNDAALRKSVSDYNKQNELKIECLPAKSFLKKINS